ncbi:CoA-acylating methylmalonate-semialdehyde dehydrogenase [Acidipropionibacterium jensenii]|uniref:CoA-acylating methylmalonate-semialdehyde dehydrogenase n=2 Tax=Acidipropionibacterium jensenii TaxID=1749 RepID=UPI002649CBA9|nr:CoA-acylating methylmalonate-semialdehyde dehydrogenase [Acidipropionibacterium jensenii]MDN6619038.1 CoA-acylating methylmalonate-semialdehyde dehydrogenase [Corynebacterium variabile]MDN5978555.1 CoA-acylating methylmalonate-semialdehyde dehydrogenase [Acidipropionibacterium jensenii]MDN5997375.1 CoA-acylating methylmalonate-semialdehyde dehydrogenase [Acidipropionibacterium jensenii]MDN6441771.1 CoA-acylating methylmalonate-semialdehyde dehydrogenase [Acidipropionibacterium jensenii]MDN6
MSSAESSSVKTMKNFIGGEWVESTSTESIDVPNPSTGEIIARVPLATREETAAAIENAAEAFKTWGKTSVIKRAKILFALQQLLERDKDELGTIITMENGKPHAEAVAEVGRGIENVMHAASIPNLLMGDSLSTVATDVEVTNYRYPIGVTSAICPFNFPMMVPFWMFPMAIACGNTMVLKPSEKTPNLMNKIIDLTVEAGLPAGVLNVVQGAKDVVNELLENPTVKSVSFVGSEGVGRYVYEHGTAHFKRVQALTGAKNHSIVLSDADIDDAVTKSLSGGFGSAGERCMAGSVILVEDAVADEFVAKFTQAAKDIDMGDTNEEDYYLGPVIRKENQERTFKYIEDGVKDGAKLVLDGREGVPEGGYFCRPTIFERVSQEMSIWKDEIFAPVVDIIRVKDLPEAVDFANSHHLANGACLFTDSATAVRYFRENIDAGMLGINLGVPAPVAYFSFSGWKDSFFGDLHANGKDSVEFYTHRKVVTAQYKQGRYNK